MGGVYRHPPRAAQGSLPVLPWDHMPRTIAPLGPHEYPGQFANTKQHENNLQLDKGCTPGACQCSLGVPNPLRWLAPTCPCRSVGDGGTGEGPEGLAQGLGVHIGAGPILQLEFGEDLIQETDAQGLAHGLGMEQDGRMSAGSMQDLIGDMHIGLKAMLVRCSLHMHI